MSRFGDVVFVNISSIYHSKERFDQLRKSLSDTHGVLIRKLMSLPRNNKPVDITDNEILDLLNKTRESLLLDSNFFNVSDSTVHIVGDICGDFKTLRSIFEQFGLPPRATYLFLGNYGNTGKQSLEVLLLLFSLKINYPSHIYLLRGKKDCSSMSRIYGFYDEIKKKRNINMYKQFCKTFDHLPLAALVQKKMFCVHGGLSPELLTLDDINRIQRPEDIPDYGLMNDLIFSSFDENATGWNDCYGRGISYRYGADIIEKFLEQYNMSYLIKGSIVCEEGYERCGDHVISLFSTPKYRNGEFDNKAAVLVSHRGNSLDVYIFSDKQWLHSKTMPY